MSDFPCAAEDREDKVCQLIDARIKAIRADIRVNRVSTVEAIADRLEGFYGCRALELAAVRNAVIYGSRYIGVTIAADVESAIFFGAEELAETDVADIERGLAEGRDDDRVAYAVMDRELA
jgi:hypothetical protein